MWREPCRNSDDMQIPKGTQTYTGYYTISVFSYLQTKFPGLLVYAVGSENTIELCEVMCSSTRPVKSKSGVVERIYAPYTSLTCPTDPQMLSPQGSDDDERALSLRLHAVQHSKLKNEAYYDRRLGWFCIRKLSDIASAP
jgi:hypothetical protein